MTSRMKNQFLFTTVALLAGMGLASAQGLSGGAAGEKGTSVERSGDGMSQTAPRASHNGALGASHGEGTTQGRATESREGGGRAEHPSVHESGSDRRGERGRADGARDSGNDQTIGQRKSGREDARQSESGKERRGANEDRTHQQENKDRTAGQGRSSRDDARRSEERAPSQENKQQAQQPSRQNPDRSGAQGQHAQDQKSNSTNVQSATQAGASSQGQNTTGEQTQTRTQLTAQQQTTLQQSVLHADNAPRVNVNSINFQVHTGVAVPSNVSIVSVSHYPALIDVFPAYRDYSFFIVEDEVVFVDRDRHIVDVVPAGPRTRFGGGHGSSSVATADLAPDDIRVIQRVLIDRGLLHGEVDGVLGPQTHEAITVFQREQGIQVTGSIDARTASSLGVSDRLSQQAKQSISQSQSSTTGSSSQTSTTGQGQGQTGVSQQSGQQNTTGQAPSQSPNQATKAPTQQNPQSTTTGQSTPSNQPNTAGNQPNTTGQATPQTKGGDKPAVNQKEPSTQNQGMGPSPSQPAPSNTPSK